MIKNLPKDFVISSLTKLGEWFESESNPEEIGCTLSQFAEYEQLFPPHADTRMIAGKALYFRGARLVRYSNATK